MLRPNNLGKSGKNEAKNGAEMAAKMRTWTMLMREETKAMMKAKKRTWTVVMRVATEVMTKAKTRKKKKMTLSLRPVLSPRLAALETPSGQAYSSLKQELAVERPKPSASEVLSMASTLLKITRSLSTVPMIAVALILVNSISVLAHSGETRSVFSAPSIKM